MVDLFGHHLPEAKREKVIGRLTNRVEIRPPFGASLMKLFGRPVPAAQRWPFGIRIRPGELGSPGVLEHEIVHEIGILRPRLVKNNDLAANAVSQYYWEMKEIPRSRKTTASNMDRASKNFKVPWLVIRHQLDLEKRFEIPGNTLGSYAHDLEKESGKTGAGLLFIKLVSDGAPWREAEARIKSGSYDELLKKWAQKHAKQG